MCKYRMHLVVAIMLLSFVGLCAQAPEWNWARAMGSSNADYAESMTTDNLGNVYVTGVFYGSIIFGTTTLVSAGGQDVFIAKYDAEGNSVWAFRAGGSGTDLAKGVCVDAFYNVYLTGSFQGTALFGDNQLSSAGSNDIYIAKLNSDGVWIWATRAGGIQSDSGAEMKICADNNVIITGAYTAGAQFGDFTLSGYGDFDIFVGKMDWNGEWMWVSKAGGSGSDLSTSVAVEPSGVVHLTGQISNSAVFGGNQLSTSGATIFVAKLTATGIWQYAVKASGLSSANRGLGIAADNEGNSYVTGQMSSHISFGEYDFSCSQEDIFITRLDMYGNFVWVKKVGGNGNDCGYDIALLSGNRLAITGRFSDNVGFGDDSFTSLGVFDNYIAIMNTQGDWVYAARGGGVDNDYCRRLAVGLGNSCYISGYMTNQASYGDISLPGYGATDVMLAKIKFPIDPPVISPPPGVYPTAVQVTLTCNTEGATIYYTQDGQTPTTESNVYSQPIQVSEDSYVKAIAYRADVVQSVVCSAYYDIYELTPQPQVYPPSGTYTDVVTVMMTADNHQTSIHYTIDGTMPGLSSPLYTSQLVFENSTTLKVRAFQAGYQPSQTQVFNYTITGTLATPMISLPGGIYPNPVFVSLFCSTPGASIRYTLDGSTPTQNSELYSDPVCISESAQIKARAYREDWIPSSIASESYTITGTCSTPQFSIVEGIYTSPVIVILSSSDIGAAIRYTLDGSDPDIHSAVYTIPIYLETGVTTIKARSYQPGWLPSLVASSTYEITGTVAAPEFSVPSGLVQTNQPISLNCSTIGAEIRYTTDGSNPLSTSQLYTTPLYVNSPTTIKAIAFKENWTPSAIVSASYQTPVSTDDEINAARIDDMEIYPNPFSTSTTILTSSKAIGLPYSLMIYNIKGECIYSKTGVCESKNSFIWDGIDSANKRTASGIYIVKFNNGKAALTRKLIRL